MRTWLRRGRTLYIDGEGVHWSAFEVLKWSSIASAKTSMTLSRFCREATKDSLHTLKPRAVKKADTWR